MTKFFFLVFYIFFFFSSSFFAQKNSLQKEIEQIISSKKAKVGVAIYDFTGKESFRFNENERLPMQSVFKFHLALAVLNEVDKGNFSLKQKILIKKSDLLPNTWSPMREKYPSANVYLSLGDILRYTVSESDNNGCDILFRLIGGTKIVNDYMGQIGVKDIAIVSNEEEMHQDWEVQFKNWTTPIAAVELLKVFYERKILSKKSYKFLWKIMVETSTGKNRIIGQLPAGTIVAHKTGTSGTKVGIASAINDIGIVRLANGKYFAISVFVCDSSENMETNEKIIADISKAAWNYFSKKMK